VRRKASPLSASAVSENGSRRDILDAAARLFRANGYRATTLRDIASAVGIKAASIYYHFSSKEELVAAVMNHGVDRVYDFVTQSLADLPDGASLRQQLEAASRAHLEALHAYGDYTSAGLKAYGDAPEEVRRAARLSRRRYETIWEDLINQLSDQGLVPNGVSLSSLRLAALGMLNWSHEWYRPERHDIAELAREFTTILLGPAPR